MAKAFFRFLRGELNGFYLTSIHNTLNKSTEEIKTFLMDFGSQQFKEDWINEETLFNLGKFAGIFLPRISKAESASALRMSNSKEVDNIEYSERGLFDIASEFFNYYHLNLDNVGTFIFERTTQEQYEDDINTLATINKKSSMIGDEAVLGYISEDEITVMNADGTVRTEAILPSPPANKAFGRFYGDQFSFLSEGTADDLDLNTRLTLSESYEVEDEEYSERGLYKPPMPDYPDINTLATEKDRSSLVGNEEVIGYISEDETDVIDSQGNVAESKIMSVPPLNKAYSDFYGNQFLFLAEGITKYEYTDPSLFMDLFKALQWVRHNGSSLKSLVEIVSLVCPNKLVEITHAVTSVDGKTINVYYNYNSDVDMTYKGQRKSLLEFLVEEKFKQVSLIENILS